ncbi:MAG: sodium:proton antiporter, partial [Herminiimonas sp.]|nr:sodium:proton antiporter [Herminiimonas sp.]
RIERQGAHIDITTIWYLIVGALLISMGLMESILQRLPLSPAMFYLPIGYALGPAGFGLLNIDIREHAEPLTIIAEIALLISLFTVGLKIRVPLRDTIWYMPLRLGFAAMVITIALLTLLGVYLLKLPLGAAVLLAAILAPTDPILASDVQIQDVGDRDRIRFSLSAEGGMNDGTTFPFVMLGLALLAVPEARPYASGWGVLLSLWGIIAGLASGWVMGWAVGRLVVYLRHHHQTALGMEEFLTLGLIALSYGVAHLVGGIGFVAVFATGVAVRQIESATSGPKTPEAIIATAAAGNPEEIATGPDTAPAYMTEMVLGFNKQLEHIAEFVMVLLLGVLLSGSGFSYEGVIVAVVLFVVVRPLSVTLSLFGARRTRLQHGLMAWFGIRGVGSMYYLLFALQYHWLPDQNGRIVSLVLTVIALSVVIHGISSTPLMDLYYRRTRRKTVL